MPKSGEKVDGQSMAGMWKRHYLLASASCCYPEIQTKLLSEKMLWKSCFLRKVFISLILWGEWVMLLQHWGKKKKHHCTIELNKKCFPAAGEVVPEVNSFLHKCEDLNLGLQRPH